MLLSRKIAGSKRILTLAPGLFQLCGCVTQQSLPVSQVTGLAVSKVLDHPVGPSKLQDFPARDPVVFRWECQMAYLNWWPKLTLKKSLPWKFSVLSALNEYWKFCPEIWMSLKMGCTPKITTFIGNMINHWIDWGALFPQEPRCAKAVQDATIHLRAELQQ